MSKVKVYLEVITSYPNLICFFFFGTLWESSLQLSPPKKRQQICPPWYPVKTSSWHIVIADLAHLLPWILVKRTCRCHTSVCTINIDKHLLLWDIYSKSLNTNSCEIVLVSCKCGSNWWQTNINTRLTINKHIHNEDNYMHISKKWSTKYTSTRKLPSFSISHLASTVQHHFCQWGTHLPHRSLVPPVPVPHVPHDL